MRVHSAIAGLLPDIRYGVRLLWRQRGYAVVAVVTMALGIAATTTLFSVAYGVVLKPLPWPDSERIVRVTETRGGQAARISGTISNGSYLAWSDQPATVEALGGYSAVPSRMTMRAIGGRDPVRVSVGRVTPSMFQVLSASPILGRVFSPLDARIGGGAYPDPQVVLLSYGLWQDMFGGQKDVLGRSVVFDDVQVTVVGVMPPGFAFPDRDTRAWLPMPIGAVIGDSGTRRLMIFGALAKMKAGSTIEQVAAEATTRARSAPDPGVAAVSLFGSAAPPEIGITPAAEALTAEVRPAIMLLLIAVALLLATATANVASLQLAHATTRQREIAVRAALGAGAARLTRQLMVESAIVGLIGGTAGVILAAWQHRLVPVMLPADFPRVEDISLDPVVLLFALAVSIATSIVCGALTAFEGRRLNLVAGIVANSNTAPSAGWRSAAGRLRGVLTAAQVALACVLIIGAALLGRSFVALMQADRGYDPVNLLTARVDLGPAYTGVRRVSFADAVLARLRMGPGVVDAAAGNALPFINLGGNLGFTMPAPRDPAIQQQVQALTRIVSPSYFAAMKLRLLEGRALTDDDTLTSRAVVVVNRSFAERYLGERALGAQLPISFGEGRRDAEVVGLVEDMRQSGATDAPAPELFVSYHQMPQRLLNAPLLFVIRTLDDPMAHVSALRTAVREQDPTIAIDSVATMEERVLTSLAKPRLYALLLTMLGVLALTIAGVGLFAVLSYSVAQRGREIGVRTALGARTRDIVALVVTHAAAVTIGGVVVGVVASLGLSRFASAFLYGVAAQDALSIAVAVITVCGIAAVASVVPAFRAARVDPVRSLRAE